jgi:secondary thiamine-phosphate synthase enzyme
MIEEINFKTKKKNELIDITKEVQELIPKDIKEGMCLVYTPHATAAIVINENYDPNVCDDIINAWKKLVPEGIWKHDQVDGNAASHIKSAIMGPSEIIPIKNGKIQLGTWQSLMFYEMDGPRSTRNVIIQITNLKN